MHKKFVNKELVIAGECDSPDPKNEKGAVPLTDLSNKFSVSFFEQMTVKAQVLCVYRVKGIGSSAT